VFEVWGLGFVLFNPSCPGNACPLLPNPPLQGLAFGVEGLRFQNLHVCIHIQSYV